MIPDLDGIRGVLARATGNGWEAAYRQDVGRLLDLVGELRLAVETGDAPALDRPGTYTPARGAEAEDLRREMEAAQSECVPGDPTFDVLQGILDRVDARDSLLWLIEREDETTARIAALEQERDAAQAALTAFAAYASVYTDDAPDDAIVLRHVGARGTNTITIGDFRAAALARHAGRATPNAEVPHAD